MINKGLTTAGLLALLGTALGCGDLDNFNAAVNVRYAPDGTLVVFAGDAIDLFDSDLSTRRASIPTSPGIFSLSDDGGTAAVSAYDSKADRSRIELFDLPNGRQSPSIDLGPRPTSTPQATAPRTWPSRRPATWSMSWAVWPADTGWSRCSIPPPARCSGLGNWAIMPTFTPDGNTVYVTETRGMICWDSRRGPAFKASMLPVPGDRMGSE